jgi:four helix bundle protein
LRIVKLYKHLCDEKHEYVLCREVLTNGTAIGAHVKAAQEADSRDAFIREMGAALQRTTKTEYWLELLRDGEFLEGNQFTSIHADWEEIKKMLVAILKSSRGQT